MDIEGTPSHTYKFRAPPLSNNAFYFTIVGHSEPEAFFVNSKDMKSFQWMIALMTSYSRQVKAGITVREIIEDMKETFDPNGIYIIPNGSGQEVHGVIHHMGLILENHLTIAISS